jgi:hypothetical protein
MLFAADALSAAQTWRDRVRSLLMLPLLLAAGCAATPADVARAEDQRAREQVGLERELAGLTPGARTSCLNPPRLEYSLKQYGDTLIYRVSRNRVFRNDTSGGCRDVGGNSTLVTNSPTGRQCSGDIATTVDRTSRFQNGSCALGEFVEYTRGS